MNLLQGYEIGKKCPKFSKTPVKEETLVKPADQTYYFQNHLVWLITKKVTVS